MIPLAMIGWMHPVLAEIAMAISSISVVGNANLLRREDIRPSYLRDEDGSKMEEGSQGDSLEPTRAFVQV